jgi:WD40 repeat protein/tetratricopeptide (TPR) repeat protein
MLNDAGPVGLAAVSPDGFLIATASGPTVRLWSFFGASFGLPLQHASPVTALAFSPGGEALVTACSDGTVRLWDLAWPTGGETWRLLFDISLNLSNYHLTALSADGQTLLRLLTGDGFGLFAQVWDVTTRKPRGPVLPAGDTGEGLVCAALGPDGGKVLLHLFDYREWGPGPDGQQVLKKDPFWLGQAGEWRRIDPPRLVSPSPSLMAFGPGAGTVLLASQDGTVRLWDLMTWQPLGPPLAHPAPTGRLVMALSPDGKTAVTARGQGAHLWNALTAQVLGPPLLHQGDIEAVAFSPDGRTLAISSADRTTRLWQVATGQPIGLPLRHPQGALAVAFLPQDTTTPTSRDPWHLPAQLAFSPDGATLLTANGEDHKARFWDAHTGRPLSLPWNVGPVTSLAFSQDSNSALTATPFQVRRWAVPPPAPEDDAARLVLWAEVAAGRYLDAAGVGIWLSPEEWRQRHKRLLAQGGPPLPAPDRLAWHRHWADELQDFPVTAFWHLERLITVEPGQWKHYLARAERRPYDRGSPSDRWREAVLADYSQAIALGAEGPEAWEGRAFVYGQGGQWDRAAADYRQAAQRGAAGAAWCKHVQALWKAGQAEAYARACAELLDRFGQTEDAALASSVASVCLLDPSPQVDLQRVARLARKGLTERWGVGSEEDPPRLRYVRPFRQVVDRERERRDTLGLALYRAGQLEAAIRCLSPSVPKDPRPPFHFRARTLPTEAQFLLLAMAYQRLGRCEQAREYLVGSVAADRPWGSFGPLAFYPALRQEAEALIGPAPRLELAEAHYRLGLTLERKKDWDAAIEHFRAAVSQKRNHALAWQHFGDVHLQKKEHGGAIPAYREALRLQPSNVEIRSRLGYALNQFALFRISQHLGLSPEGKQEAVELAKEAVGLFPGEGDYWHTLGVAHYRAEEWQAAITALEKAVELRQGGDSSDWFFLAMSHWQRGGKEVARTWYEAALVWMDKHRADDEALRRSALEAAQLLGLPLPVRANPVHPARAVPVWSRLLEVKATHRIALHERGEGYAALAQWDKAAADYARVVGSEPLSDAGFQLACARLLAGDTRGYREQCKQVRERAGATKDPHVAYLASRLGMLSPQGVMEPAQVLHWAEQAVASQPRCAWYLHTLGAAHYRAGNWDQAIRRCRESQEADLGWPGRVLNELMLAMAHQRQGHAGEAQQWWKKAAQDRWQAAAPRARPSDWLELNVLYREAKALFKESPEGKSGKKPE